MTETPSPAAPRRSPAPLIIGGLLLLTGGVWGVRQWSWGRTHVETDDAYLTGDLVNVSPVIGGTLAELPVAEGDTVKEGQLLARLDSDAQTAALHQAEAALLSARSQVPQAKANLLFQQQSTEAAIQHAQAAVTAQEARVGGAQAQVALAQKTTQSQLTQAQQQVKTARAQAEQAEAQAKAAAAQVQQTEAQVSTSRAALTGAEQAVESARKGVQALAARLPAAQAETERASKDEARYKALLTKEAVTQQQFDTVHSQAESARAALVALRAQVEQAQSQVKQAEAQVAQSRSQVQQAESAVAQARAAQTAAEKAAQTATAQVKVAEAGVGVAQAGGTQVAVQSSNLSASTAQTPGTLADVATATAGRTQVDAKRAAVATAQAQATQAEASVRSAQKALRNTTLYSPTTGTVVKKMVNVGASLAPGQTVLTLTQGESLWLTANFKETQVARLKPGQLVTIFVDALPGKLFHGQVTLIGATTGAAVSLLPPDNATGNFTKVVQRIPVKISLSGDTHELRQGMSCTASVELK